MLREHSLDIVRITTVVCVCNNIILRHLPQNRNRDAGNNNNKQKLNQNGLNAQEHYPDSKNWARNKPLQGE